MAQLEFEIIQTYFKDSGLCFERNGVDLGIGDDCALLSPDPQQQLAISMDLLAEGVHFPESALPQLIAQRALAVNLSDLAAVGAEPLCFTLGLSLPQSDPRWLEAFSNGLLATAKLYKCPLVGGDLIKGNLQLAIQVQGQIPRGQALLRSGAKPGDLIYVTGFLGDAAAALILLDAVSSAEKMRGDHSILELNKLSIKHRDYLINAFYKPTPRITVGVALRQIASAAIDISDGLLSDLGHIIAASGVGAELDIDQVPLSDPLRQGVKKSHQLSLALNGGDDYELCITVPPQRCDQAEESLARLGIPFTRIGEIIDGDQIKCLDSQGEEVIIEPYGYDHFREEG